MIRTWKLAPLALLLAGAARAEPPPEMDLDTALQAASASVGVAMAEAQLAAAEAQLAVARTARLPTIDGSANLLVYDAAQTFSLVPSDTPLDCTGIPEPFFSLCAGFGEETIVREQVTASVGARVAVPITGQFAIDRRIAAARAGARAGAAGLDGARRAATTQVLATWFAARDAENQLDLTRSRVSSLTQRLAQIRVAEQVGNATRLDVLQVEVALGAARGQELAQQAAVAAAWGRLGMAVGTDGHPVRPSHEVAPAPPPSPGPADPWIERALQSRPELVAARAQVDAAKASLAATNFGRIPQVTAIGAARHAEGQGVFAEPDTFYAGATAEMNLWAWGRLGHQARAAAAQRDLAIAQLHGLEAATRVEVAARVAAVDAARLGWEVAEAAAAQAAEAFRITEARYAAGAGTLVEVLDAEAEQLRATSAASTALHEATASYAALTQLAGPPS